MRNTNIVKKANKYSIKEAAKIIRLGGIVAFPTETVYGLGANALDPVAVGKIFEIKKRPSFDPLIVHISSLKDLPKLAHATKLSKKIAAKFWPGPLTIVLPKKQLVPDLVTSGLNTIAIRMPDNKIALKIISESKVPIAAPSANKFGHLSPTKPEHILKNLKGINLIIDGGKTKIGLESTIITLKGNICKILRPGAITKDDLKHSFPQIRFSEFKRKKIISPGILKSHYAPKKPLLIINKKNKNKIEREKSALISFSGKDIIGYKKVIFLTKNGNLLEYASKLFSTLHKLEKENIDWIVVEPVPKKGIGIAIMDRLEKASFKG